MTFDTAQTAGTSYRNYFFHGMQDPIVFSTTGTLIPVITYYFQLVDMVLKCKNSPFLCKFDCDDDGEFHWPTDLLFTFISCVNVITK